ncbi:DUF4214 domain-containing protein [Pseudomonas luteola]|uniref:DUF4214 domain-containing protein n=1 Tax=Pseudomonas luteola TaxID=47886 RepID=UPI00289EF156|nr:DUF4214 domain-containing protein [Pseudomonas luteola]
MIEVTNRSISPYKQVCYIETYWPDGQVSRGSGSIVGNNDVLSALHVVYDAEHGGLAEKVMVTPGAFVNDHNFTFSAPFGTYSANSWVGRVSNWDTNGDGLLSPNESGHDLAVISLNVNISSVTGILATSSASDSFSAILLGYPARGTGLMESTGYATSYPSYPIYSINTGLGEGASGGPLLDMSSGAPVIRGVLSSGNTNDTLSRYAGLSEENYTWYSQSVTNNDYLLTGSTHRPVGFGVTSGSDHNDYFFEHQASLDSNRQSSLYGYKGADILFMDGSSSMYSRYIDSADTDTLHITNNYTRAQLSLHDINVVSFSNKNIYVLTEDQAQIARLYTVFDRAPDFNGLQGWLNAYAHGTSFNAIANTFSQSLEFANHYNAVDNYGFASQLYSTILGRAGEANGLAYWTNELNHGMSRGDAMIAFTNSLESQIITESDSGFIQIVDRIAWTDADSIIQRGVVFGSTYGDHISENEIKLDSNGTSELYGYKGGDILELSGSFNSYQISSDTSDPDTVHLLNKDTNAQYLLHDVNMLSFSDKNIYILSEDQAQIARLYTVFDRAPDFNGLQGWLNAYAHGTSFNAIANTFSQSLEFANHYNAVDNYGFASQLYSTILGRAGEANGLAYWTNELNYGMSRGDAMIAFTNSAENHLLTEGAAGFIQIVGHSEWI